MAIRFFDCKGYGQIEPSQVWFTREGSSESQCELDPDVFASHFPILPAEAAEGKIVAENGMFLMIDKERKIATLPSKELSELGYQMGINYSTERIYNQYTPGRRNFCMIAGEFNPRIGFVEPGMRICTNAVAWNDGGGRFKGLTTSDQVYAKVKSELAKMRDAGKGRKIGLDADGEHVTAAGYDEPKPIYVGVTDISRGKLVLGVNLENVIGGVLGVVTEAYYNADNTDAFKIMFINPNTVKKD